MFFDVKKIIMFLLVFSITSSAMPAAPTVDQRIKNLTLGDNLVVFDASGESGSDPYMNCWYPKSMQIHVVKCSKKLDNFVGLSQLIQGFKSHTKKEEKHRESWIGQMISRIKKQTYKHPFDSKRLGQPLVDEYEIAINENNGDFVFCFFLDTPAQLAQLASYFKKHFAKRETTPGATKPLLVLTIRQDQRLELVDQKSMQVIREYFQPVDYTDPRVKNFVFNSQRAMVECGNDLEGGYHKRIESLGGTILRMTEENANDFSAKKIIPKVLFGVTGGLIMAAYIKALNDGCMQWLPGVKWINEKLKVMFAGDDKKMQQTGEQLLVQRRLQDQLNALGLRIDNALTTATTAQERATTAQERAGGAHEIAGIARDRANAAQVTANAAQVTANAAQVTANAAQDRVVDAVTADRETLRQAFESVLRELKDDVRDVSPAGHA